MSTTSIKIIKNIMRKDHRGGKDQRVSVKKNVSLI